MEIKRTTDHPLITKLKEFTTRALHMYFEGSSKIHIYPGNRHPSKKDICEMHLKFFEKRHLYPEDLIDQDFEDWFRNKEFVLHRELDNDKMTSEEYERYFQKT